MKITKSISYAGVVEVQTPECQLYLVVNKTKEAVKKFLVKEKLSKESIDNIISNLEDIDDKFQGLFLRTPLGTRFLYIRSYIGCWEDLDVLSHELFHMVDFEAQYRCFEKEPEFKAYLHGGLFKQIRRLLGILLDKQANKDKRKKSKAKPRLKTNKDAKSKS